MTKLRRNTAALALLCVGTIAAVCGVRAGGAGASDGAAVPVAVPAESVTCPPGAPGPNDPDVQAAIGELDAWGADAGSRSYLGSFPCPTPKTVMVYRLPGHPDLDRQAVSIGARHHVSIALVNSESASGR
ncbi:MAG TPA: hypothetical protein VE081_02595 [Sporichthyaceae bacterium]|nr:hypothetical protein [Sporichthyaceae bacterium]